MSERSERMPGARAPASRTAMGPGGAAPEQAQHSELRALVDGYAVANDARDGNALRELFADDATLTIVQPDGAEHTYEGAAAIAAIPAKLARYGHTLHLVSTHLARVDGDRGTGVAYCEAHHVAAGGDRILFIRYEDDYVRTGGTWRFGARTVRVLWTEDR